MLAIKSLEPAAMKMLILRGADLNIQGGQHARPRHLAALQDTPTHAHACATTQSN